VIRDITELVSAEQSVRDARNLTQTLVNNAPLLAYVKDLDGRFLLANRQLESLLDPVGPGVIGRTSHDFRPKEIADTRRADDLVVTEGRMPISVEEVNEEADGTHTYLTAKFPIFDADGDVYGVGSLSADITQLKQSEHELAEGNARLERMVKEITEAMGRVVEVRDPYTKGHETRVAHLAMALAEHRWACRPMKSPRSRWRLLCTT